MGSVEIILTLLPAADGSAVVLAALAAWLGYLRRNSDEHYEKIRRACSTLRSALAGDIESRREGPQ